MEIGETLYVKDRRKWREWLVKNWDKKKEIWLVYYRKASGKPRIPYDDAVEEALCYGWIDGLVNRIDDTYFKKYFSQRRPKSIWSTKNKLSIERLIKEGKMTEHGYKIIDIAKKNGCYDRGDALPEDFSLESFDEIVKPFENAYVNYKMMSSSIRKLYALTYFTAKKEETRQKRLKEIIERLEKNLKPMEREKEHES